MSNTRIWAAVPKTDMAYTKNANVNGNQQTSISGLYMVKLATEVLGPIGEAWGYDVAEERFENTKPITLNGEYLKDGDSLVWEQTHTVRLELWHGSRENTITQFGHTRYRYVTNNGRIMVDEEAPKKSVTDAMKKCLSLLGICSDVYMGLFDDVNYQQAARVENDIKKASDGDAEIAKKLAELEADIADGVKAIPLCPNADAVARVYSIKATKIDRLAPLLMINADEYKKPLAAAYHEKMKEFKE